MPATILKTNFIVHFGTTTFQNTSGELLLLHTSYIVVNRSEFYEFALTVQRIALRCKIHLKQGKKKYFKMVFIES